MARELTCFERLPLPASPTSAFAGYGHACRIGLDSFVPTAVISHRSARASSVTGRLSPSALAVRENRSSFSVAVATAATRSQA